MVGDYGSIHQPIAVDDRFDYILFSNDINQSNVGIWQVRSIPEVVKNDNKRLSRYPKTHPETLLSEYDASLYIDANIQIADSWVYERIIECFEKNYDTAGIQLVLSGRDCIYRHAYDMCAIQVEHDYNAIRQCHAMMKRGFPEHFGLNENNIIYRTHNEKMKKVDEEWWWWITHYSFRDQFSYMFCFWKYNIERHLFLPAGEDSRNSKHFVLYQHNELENVSKTKWVHCGLFEWLRNQSRHQSKQNYNKYCNQWITLCKANFPQLALFFWGIYASFKASIRAIFRRLVRKKLPFALIPKDAPEQHVTASNPAKVIKATSKAVHEQR